MSDQSIHAAIEALVIRGKVQSGTVNGRTLLQVTGLAEDVFNNIEHVMPYGIVGVPVEGSDIVLLQIGAFASHQVAIAGDNTADAVSDLQPGEGGLSLGGQMILLKIGRTEIVSPLLQWGTLETALKRLVQEAFVQLFNTHTHDGGSPPDQQMNATHLTGGS
jgi:phage gp45-like